MGHFLLFYSEHTHTCLSWPQGRPLLYMFIVMQGKLEYPHEYENYIERPDPGNKLNFLPILAPTAASPQRQLPVNNAPNGVLVTSEVLFALHYLHLLLRSTVESLRVLFWHLYCLHFISSPYMRYSKCMASPTTCMLMTAKFICL